MQAKFFHSAALLWLWLWLRRNLAALKKPKAPMKCDLLVMAFLKGPVDYQPKAGMITVSSIRSP